MEVPAARLLVLLLLGAWAPAPGSASPEAPPLVNEDVKRTVDLSSHLAKVTAEVVLAHPGGSSTARATSFLLALEPELEARLAHLGVQVSWRARALGAVVVGPRAPLGLGGSGPGRRGVRAWRRTRQRKAARRGPRLAERSLSPGKQRRWPRGRHVRPPPRTTPAPHSSRAAPRSDRRRMNGLECHVCVSVSGSGEVGASCQTSFPSAFALVAV